MSNRLSRWYFIYTVMLSVYTFASCSPQNEAFRSLRAFEITVTASDQGNLPAVNTINYTGLNGDLCDNQWKYTWGTSPESAGGGLSNPHAGTEEGAAWIKFEFDKIHNLKEMWIWNYNAPSDFETARGLKNVVIEYTADGKLWNKLGDYEFARATGDIDYEHNTTIDFNSINAKAVIVTAKKGIGIGNYKDKHNMYGLSEVRFCVNSNSDIPELHYEADLIPSAKLALEPKRGVSLDRTYHTVPEKPNFESGDVQLIKSMGFDFLKLIVNPAVHKSGSEIANMNYIDEILNLVTNEDFAVVLCIHPEPDFKRLVFGNEKEFEDLCTWYESFSNYVASRWDEKQLVFQMMTEPHGNSYNVESWNSWNNLLPRMWEAIRKGMPRHTIILSGDQTGTIEGILNTRPVKDENVMYAFSFYEPTFFTWQGAGWQDLKNTYISYTQSVPYPSSPEIIKAKLPEFIKNVPSKLKNEARTRAALYGAQNWNKQKIASEMQKVVEWSNYYGGGLKLFCGEFGCYQRTVKPDDRYTYIKDIREVFESNNISWACWSYNETLTIMSLKDRVEFGPPEGLKPDLKMLSALLDRKD